MKSTAFNISVLALLVAGLPASAQEPSQSKPKLSFDTVLLPWKTLGVSPEVREQQKPALQTALDYLADQALTDSSRKKLIKTLNNRKVSSNFGRRASGLLVGRRKISNSSGPVAIQPIWCSIADRYVFFAHTIHLETGVLLSSGHASIPRTHFVRGAQASAGKTNTIIQQQLRQAWAENQNTAQPGKDKGTNFTLRLAADQNKERYGSNQCLNLLLEEELIKQHSITSGLGYASLEQIRQLVRSKRQFRRHSRTAVVVWHRENTGTKLPLKLNAHIRFSESVFGSSIRTQNLKGIMLSNAANSSNVALTGNLKAVHDFFATEEESLNPNVPPRMVAQHGYWIYLDRGRAYGLRLNDRLEAPGPVKGHVVRFFGPELKLLNAEGKPIHEGAILFVRSGHKHLSKGLAFAYDATKFPTSWPPK